jgi:hypothetical protein
MRNPQYVNHQLNYDSNADLTQDRQDGKDFIKTNLLSNSIYFFEVEPG